MFCEPLTDPRKLADRHDIAELKVDGPRAQLVCWVTADVTEPVRNGYLLMVASSCGVVFVRWVTPEEADADLLRLASLN
jgi:hypothetical protein